MTSSFIDTARFSSKLRRRGIDAASRRILVTRYENSVQAKDLTLPPNCGSWGRIHHFRRSQGDGWPENPLPIDPALQALHLSARNEVRAQVFQNAICSWRCWYCYVDFELLSANPLHSDFKTADELIDLFLAEDDRPSIIDLSGGQPDLVPEWTLWFTDALRERELDRSVYLWSDDNLSNDYLWKHLTKDEIGRLVSYPNYGRVGCFKGFDEHSFAFNTGAEPSLFNSQFTLMKRLVDADFDVYAYATFTTDSDLALATNMKHFVDRLQEIHPLFPLRTVPLRIVQYTPTQSRMGIEQQKALEVQWDAVAAWVLELEKRFPESVRNLPIYSQQLR